MTKKKIATTTFETESSTVRQTSPYHSIDAMLHTIRCIAQYEDILRELSYEVKRQGALTEATKDELRDVLENIPSHDLLIDLTSVSALLGESRTPMVRKGGIASARKVAKPVG